MTVPARSPHYNATSFGAVRGNTPVPSGAGDTPDIFKKRMQRLASLTAIEERLTRVLTDPEADHSEWLAAFREAADRGYGKAAQPVTGEDGGALVITVRREG